ncbi:hypothetical protein [Geminisphaera colitermitum]|uniref:hypothetical protein n=1 Tax=Geminisphaera colitermitum TaxID=1148786 RepID=UPI000158C828|nr:hypothetical protein [Geminisphaera colitermitum]
MAEDTETKTNAATRRDTEAAAKSTRRDTLSEDWRATRDARHAAYETRKSARKEARSNATAMAAAMPQSAPQLPPPPDDEPTYMTPSAPRGALRTTILDIADTELGGAGGYGYGYGNGWGGGRGGWGW